MKKIIETPKSLTGKIPPSLKRIIDWFIIIVVCLFIFAVVINLGALIFLLFKKLSFLPWVIMGLTSVLVFLLSKSLDDTASIYRIIITLSIYKIIIAFAVLMFFSFIAKPIIIIPSFFLFYFSFILGLKKEKIKIYFKYSRRKRRLRKKLESLKSPSGEQPISGCTKKFIFVDSIGNRQLIETKIDPRIYGITSGQFMKMRFNDTLLICVGVGFEKTPFLPKNNTKFLWVLEEDGTGICHGEVNTFQEFAANYCLTLI